MCSALLDQGRYLSTGGYQQDLADGANDDDAL